MKKLFTFFLALAASVGIVFAWDYEHVQIGDLYYNLDSSNRTAEVTREGQGNYNNYVGLSAANIPSSVLYNGASYTVIGIGGEAFIWCNFNSIAIPNTLTYIKNYAFHYASVGDVYITDLAAWCNIQFEEANRATTPLSFGTGRLFLNGEEIIDLVIPSGVTELHQGAFQGGAQFTSVSIPNTITSIGYNAFSGCGSLNAVHISDLVAWCNITFAATYSSNPLSYAHHLYLNNEEVKDLEIPNTVTSIKAGAFEGGSNIISVSIPNSVTSIESYAFSGCNSLKAVTLHSIEPIPLCWEWEWEEYSGTECAESVFPNGYSNNLSIYVPCGSMDIYQNAAGWSDYASKIKYTSYPSYTITKVAENGYISTTTTEFTICDEPLVICTAKPNNGCYFVSWADGITDNPREIELTQDTTMEAIFDYLLEGKCGKDSALVWKLDTTTMALEITGKGALSENYTYGTFIESLTIGNEVTLIGQSAFYGCNNLKNVILGSSVKVLEEYAFYYCSAIETITCYSQRPPTVNNYALYGLDYSTIVYVPADYLETYKMHDAWGLYDVRPLGAKSTETTDVNVTPAENTAEVAWPAVSGAATYELVIKDKSGNVICTLIFNANGQLTSIAFAPSRNGAPQQTQAAGFSFTVTGLEEGTSYDLTITSKDNNGSTLDTKTVSFTTTGEAQGIEEISAEGSAPQKVMINGQIFILRGDKTYTLQGQEVK